MFKRLDHNQNIEKVKRVQSSYKRHLMERLIEKGSRGKEIRDKKSRLSEMAVQNTQSMRNQF